jgi:hypothetical protein
MLRVITTALLTARAKILGQGYLSPTILAIDDNRPEILSVENNNPFILEIQ